MRHVSSRKYDCIKLTVTNKCYHILSKLSWSHSAVALGTKSRPSNRGGGGRYGLFK